jgi:nitroreductase
LHRRPGIALIWIKPCNGFFVYVLGSSVPLAGAKMDLKEAIYTRRAVRDFTSESVGDKVIYELIEAAVQAPSAINQQPCSFCVVRDKAVLAKISREAKVYMLRSTPVGLMSHHFQQILNDANFDIFYHAPVLIVISAVADIPWAVEDCALAAENLMLSARGAGLGTCWIGFAQGWLGTAEGKALLKLPAAYRPCAPIILGHPKSQPPAVPRKAPQISWIGT